MYQVPDFRGHLYIVHVTPSPYSCHVRDTSLYEVRSLFNGPNKYKTPLYYQKYRVCYSRRINVIVLLFFLLLCYDQNIITTKHDLNNPTFCTSYIYKCTTEIYFYIKTCNHNVVITE